MSSNNLPKTFTKSSIFYKMRENFPSMRVSVRIYQIACVSRTMRETWKVCSGSQDICIQSGETSDMEAAILICK